MMKETLAYYQDIGDPLQMRIGLDPLQLSKLITNLSASLKWHAKQNHGFHRPMRTASDPLQKFQLNKRWQCQEPSKQVSGEGKVLLSEMKIYMEA